MLAELFVETEDTVFIYNQGRCFEQNLRYEQAIGRFQEFLRASPRATRQEKVEANKHIADCQALLDKRTEKGPATAEHPVAPASEPVEQPAHLSDPLPAQVAVQTTSPIAPAVPDSAGAGLRLAGVLTASVGGLAFAAGVALNVKANSLTSELERPSNYTRSKASQRETYITLGWVGYGVGATCVAGGIVLYYLGYAAGQRPKSYPSMALMPSIGPNEVGATLGGAF